MRIERQDGGESGGYSKPTLRSEPLPPTQLPPKIQFIKRVLIAVAILAAIIGVPTLAAETIASGVPLRTIEEIAWSVFGAAAVFMMVSIALLQMGWDS